MTKRELDLVEKLIWRWEELDAEADRLFSKEYPDGMGKPVGNPEFPENIKAVDAKINAIIEAINKIILKK